MNLFDIMQAAGGGNAFAEMARRFGLTEEQTRRAVEAFLPAFSAGLKRSTSDPLGLMKFMRHLSVGDYMRAYQNPAFAWGAGKAKSDDALSFLFGSPEIAQQLAEQASAFTGIDQRKLAEMAPTLAAMTFGGLAQQAASMNPALKGMMDAFGDTPARTPKGKGPLDRYEEEQENRDRAAAEKAAAAQAEMMQTGLAAFQAGATVWQEAVGSMMKTTGGGVATGTAGSPEAKASGEALFGEIFEPGRKLGDAYQRAMEDVLTQVRPETKRS